jgi:hypothetical protein
LRAKVANGARIRRSRGLRREAEMPCGANRLRHIGNDGRTKVPWCARRGEVRAAPRCEARASRARRARFCARGRAEEANGARDDSGGSDRAVAPGQARRAGSERGGARVRIVRPSGTGSRHSRRRVGAVRRAWARQTRALVRERRVTRGVRARCAGLDRARDLARKTEVTRRAWLLRRVGNERGTEEARAALRVIACRTARGQAEASGAWRASCRTRGAEEAHAAHEGRERRGRRARRAVRARGACRAARCAARRVGAGLAGRLQSWYGKSREGCERGDG